MDDHANARVLIRWWSIRRINGWFVRAYRLNLVEEEIWHFYFHKLFDIDVDNPLWSEVIEHDPLVF